MKKKNFLIFKKGVKNLNYLTVLFVCIALISSSSLSANLNNNLQIKNSNFETTEGKTPIIVETSAGLAPNIDSENRNKLTRSVSLGDTMWGYVTNSSIYDEGPCYFYFDDPGDIGFLNNTESDDFLSGGTCVSEKWIACENSTGALWEIDIDNGDMTYIGGGDVGLNGLAFDPVYCKLYGASGDSLFQIDPDDGSQELIGSFGADVDEMIAIAADLNGIMYGWDLGDKLWTIDLETGEATEIGPLGIDLNYAQDGCFEWDTGYLWLTAFTISPNYGSYLYVYDVDTEECELIGQFEGNSQITASVASFICCPYHDVGVKTINYPESGYAIPDIPMQVTVKNYEWYTEITDVQMQVNTYEDGVIILEEDFSGSFPPDGWTTDWWEQSNTDYACGEEPEAHCNKYTQANQGDDYDNYIMSKPLDCSNIEAVKLSFKLTIDLLYHDYCSFCIKYRKDSNSLWKDITPWDNPLQLDIDCEPFSITIYGDPYLGEEFQVKWEYIGYYYYFNDLYLDNVKIIERNCLDEYNEFVEGVELESGEEIIVDFPAWTPSYWQDSNYENTWQEFLVKACTLLDGDDKPENDCKQKTVNLYFPWLHDIEITSIDSPCEDGPGKTYPVKATIKNVGQYADCCIPIDIKIGEQVVLETLLTEESWETVPPAGWYDEHKDFSNNYGWDKSYTTYSGGDFPEAILRYNQALPDNVFYSYAIDTSDYSDCQLEFRSYINHYAGSGLYALEAGYSTDKETWYAAWHEEPDISGQYDIQCTIEGGHETLYIGFWVKGDPYYFNYWYIDNIFVKKLDFVLEYSDNTCQGDELEPGESRTFEFDEWTPDFLQNKTTGSIEYVIQTEIEMEEDKNPGNDIKTEYFTLEYWHDVVIDEVTSPDVGDISKGDLLWDNGEPDGENALPGSIYQGYSNIIIDDFQHNDNVKWYATDVHFRFIWDSGYYLGNLETVRVYFYKNNGGCNPSLDEWAEVEVTDFDEWATGDFYFGRPEIAVDVEFEEVYLLCEGEWYVGFQPEGIEDDIAYLLTAESKGCQVMADLPYLGHPRWTSSQDIWGEEYDLAWQLTGYCTCMCPRVYIQPGIEDIDAIVKNYGTFPETDLTCYAEIYEYITDPENGTLVYEDSITDIDLEEPLGGEEILEFEDYVFSMEGIYKLELDIPVLNDDYPNSNNYILTVKVDDTAPYSWYTLDPPVSDGENGWYVSDVEVTLEAIDPVSNEISSGVKEIKYRVNGGPIKTIPWCGGTFVLTEDGEDILIEYWAIDYVGNEETPHNTFTIDMDQTEPAVTLFYKTTDGNPSKSWTILCTATATDELSGIGRVEFYLNDELQETIEEPGPYTWSFKFSGGLNIIVRAFAWDKAGNHEYDESKISVNRNRILHSIHLIFLRFLDRFPLIQHLFDVLGVV